LVVITGLARMLDRRGVVGIGDGGFGGPLPELAGVVLRVSGRTVRLATVQEQAGRAGVAGGGTGGGAGPLGPLGRADQGGDGLAADLADVRVGGDGVQRVQVVAGDHV